MRDTGAASMRLRGPLLPPTRPPLWRRILDIVRGDPAPRTAPRVFVSDGVRVVGWMHAITGGSIVASVLFGILLALVAVMFVSKGGLLWQKLPIIAAIAAGGFLYGWTLLRAAVRLLDGDARGHRVLLILVTIQSVLSIAYTGFAMSAGRPWLRVVPGVMIAVGSLLVLRKWRPGSAETDRA